MPASINGIGTRWYGKALEESDGSYVVTEWATFVYIPFLPLGSKRVWPQGGNEYRVARVAIHWPHILAGYAVLGGIALLLKIAG